MCYDILSQTWTIHKDGKGTEMTDIKIVESCKKMHDCYKDLDALKKYFENLDTEHKIKIYRPRKGWMMVTIFETDYNTNITYLVKKRDK